MTYILERVIENSVLIAQS